MDQPKEPLYPAEDLNSIIQFNQKMAYEFEAVLARLIDGSEHLEFRPDYGPEVYCGLAKVDGLPVGILANRLGFLPPGYPEYARGEYQGIGGKLYRQGLIKLNEFRDVCAAGTVLP